MNNSNHRRIPVFAYGLIIGLLVGVLISLGILVYFYLNDNENLEKPDKEVQLYKKPSKVKNQKNKTNIHDSSYVDNQSDSLELNENSNYEGNDSIGLYDNETYTYNDENIRVAQEQLLQVRNILPSGNKSNFYCQTNKYDSLLNDNIPINSDGRFRVEFWASPIKFVGYKLSNNKLILFGFYEFDAVSLEYISAGGLKMKYLSNEYKLNCTDDFIRLTIKKNK